MKVLKKIVLFVFVFILSTQLIFSYFFPDRYVYDQRVNYEVFKDNIYSYEATLRSLKEIISQQKLDEYYIFIGDSVGYGTPCPPDKTIASYMNTLSKSQNKPIKVFNLALPSTMFGDFYVMLLLFDKYGISTDHLILNFSYWEINNRNPAYWFKEYLKAYDRENYDKMVERGAIKDESVWVNARAGINRFLNNNINIIGYSGFTSNKIKMLTNKYLKEPQAALSVWSSKPYVVETIKKPENKWYYSDNPFDFTENSIQLFFLNKIFERQKNKDTIYILNAMNNQLLPEDTSKQGYQDNIKAIEKYFGDRKQNFVNYNGKVDYKLFSDHVHLLPEGYKFIAQDLLTRIEGEN